MIRQDFEPKGAWARVMSAIRLVDRGISSISVLSFRAAAIVCLAVSLAVFVEVVSRYGRLGLRPFAVEISSCSLAFIIFLATGYTLAVGGHVRVSILLKRFPQKMQLVIDSISYAIVFIFTSFTLKYFYSYWLESLRKHIVSFGVPPTPLWIPQLFVLFGLGVLGLEAIRLFIKSILSLVQGK